MLQFRFKSSIMAMIQKMLATVGYTAVKTDARNLRFTMAGTIKATAKRNHRITTVIDVGASDGSWSHQCMQYFPNCNYLLIEAQQSHENSLKQFCTQHGNSQFIVAAAGETSGKIFFNANDPFGGQASYKPFATNNIEVPVISIDHEIKARKLEGPYLIKLDTHGFEVPILKGASATLKQTEAIIIECYNFKIAPECLLFHEMCDYLSKLGFRCIDLVDTMHRQHDDAFWQMDLVFVKESRPEFSYLEYQ